MRLFLDTNVFILGASIAGSPSALILDWLGFDGRERPDDVVVLMSAELQDQIRRVARRVGGKDWAGQIINRTWTTIELDMVRYDEDDDLFTALAERIPREDVKIYLTAKDGNADCFVSTNHKLIKAIAIETGAFACYTPEQFVDAYISGED